MQYSEYELSDEHMRGLIGDATAHPILRKVRKDHFEAWLAEHDRRVKAEAWDAITRALSGEAVEYFPENPYHVENS